MYSKVFGPTKEILFWREQARVLLGWPGNFSDKGQRVAGGLAQGLTPLYVVVKSKLFQFQVLHFLYDKDVLEDAVIIDWMEEEGEDKEVKDKMRKKCKAFIQWLEEADSESEED